MTSPPILAASASGSVRRNVVLLAICQALFMCVTTTAIATTPLAGHALLGPDKTLATLPLVFFHVGIMVTTVPASLLMAHIGRRAGFSLGALICMLSGLVSTAAIFQQNFLLLCAGSLLMGGAAAFCSVLPFCRSRRCRCGLPPKCDLAGNGRWGACRFYRAANCQIYR